MGQTSGKNAKTVIWRSFWTFSHNENFLKNLASSVFDQDLTLHRISGKSWTIFPENVLTDTLIYWPAGSSSPFPFIVGVQKDCYITFFNAF